MWTSPEFTAVVKARELGLGRGTWGLAHCLLCMTLFSLPSVVRDPPGETAPGRNRTSPMADKQKQLYGNGKAFNPWKPEPHTNRKEINGD